VCLIQCDELRSCYTDSVVIFKLQILSSVHIVSLQVSVSLTYCWYLLQVQKRYKCVHSLLMHCNSNVGTTSHGTRVGAPDGSPCHATKMFTGTGSAEILACGFCCNGIIVRAVALGMPVNASWSMGSIVLCIVTTSYLVRTVIVQCLWSHSQYSGWFIQKMGLGSSGTYTVLTAYGPV
jgi:hypothetical protein